MGLNADDPTAGDPADRPRAWSFRGVRFVAARYVAHRYCPHFHDDYSIGVILRGVLGFRRGKHGYAAGGGLISAINPGEVHTGVGETPGGWTACNLMVGPDALRALVAGGDDGLQPVFQAPVIDDAGLAARLLRAHRLSASGASDFEKEAALIDALAGLFIRHAPRGARPGPLRATVARAACYIRDNYAADISLADTAAAAGLSKHHFLRTFAQEMDITPHAYLVQIRVREATRLLRSGHSPAAAAVAAGFADQSHFNRCFKRTYGLSPGAFLRAA